MKRLIFAGTIFLAVMVLLADCSRRGGADNASGAPPPAQVESEGSSDRVRVAHPEQFPLATASEHKAAPALTVTGVVAADIARTVPAISLASGRVTEVKARLGDTVKKGQLLMKVWSADIAGAFSDYRQAVADVTLAKAQLERAKVLFERGAVAQKDLVRPDDGYADSSDPQAILLGRFNRLYGGPGTFGPKQTYRGSYGFILN